MRRREHFRVKGDTTSQLVASGAIAYGMTCAFVLVRLGQSQSLLAGVLRIRSDTDHPGPPTDINTAELRVLTDQALPRRLLQDEARCPSQTAVLVLGDVLGFATAEAAAAIDTTRTAAKGALQTRPGHSFDGR